VRDGGTVPPSSYTKSARIQSRALDDLVDPGRVLALFADGATIVLQALHRYWEPVASFCRDLETTLTHPVQVNVYLTPPASRGLDVHYDTHDVFVLQVSGAKHWEVFDRAFHDPLAHHRRTGSYPDPGTPAIDVELKPGDCLYIPRGFLHGAETTGRESTHMTVGILTSTWMDVLAAATKRAEHEPFMRAALPPGFASDPASVRASAADAFHRLARWIEELDPVELVDDVAQRFWATRAPMLGGQLQELLDLDGISDATTVRRRRGTVMRARLDGDRLLVTLGDRVLDMPAHIAPALRAIEERTELMVGDLSPHLDEAGRTVLVRRLVAEGVLERARASERLR
jgi:bifunctional lysine-specific demethylase and histidyl-hydroxylase NO66